MSRCVYVLVFRGRVFNVQYVPKVGRAVIVSNHQSYFDPVMVGLGFEREASFMARDSLFQNRYFGGLIRHLNAFPVRRGTADLGAIKESLRRLKAGGVLVTFPESTRSLDGKIAPMQAGVVLLARRTKSPIVPAFVHGAYEVWPRDRRIPRLRPLLVAFGRPIEIDELADMSDADAIVLVRERILLLQRRYAPALATPADEARVETGGAA